MAKSVLPNGITWISAQQTDAESMASVVDTLNRVCPQSVLHAPIRAKNRCADEDPIRDAWDVLHPNEASIKPVRNRTPRVPRPIPTFSEIMNQDKKTTVSG